MNGSPVAAAGCGLRRAEVAKLSLSELQLRDNYWVIVELIGKGRHIRTVPVPGWVKTTIDDWTTAAKISVEKTVPVRYKVWLCLG